MNFTKPTLLLIAGACASALFLPVKARAAAGDLYQVYPPNGTIFKYSPGNGSPSVFTGGLATTANKIAFNREGEMYADEGTGSAAKIVKLSPTGVKTTFATGIDAQGMACDAAGNLFVSDATSQTILKITPAGVKTTFAGKVGHTMLDLMFDTDGNLLAVDYGTSPLHPSTGGDGEGSVAKFAPDGHETLFASKLDRPTTLATDRAGIIYVGTSDGGVFGGSLVYDAKSGLQVGSFLLYAANLGNIQGMACDPAGNLFVSTPSGIIRLEKKTRAKTVFSSVAGIGGLAFEPPYSQPLNISTRLQVQPGDNALFAGFIVTGNAGKKVLIRGIGPSLAAAGISGALQDPIIELRNSSGAFVNGNNDWKSTQQAAIEATGAAPTDPRESAFLITLGPGSWTVVLRGVGNTSGVGVVEVYDLDTTANSRLANISSRGVVQSGENVMIGGFIIGSGNGAARLAIRAIGPSLAAAVISNPLPDPTLTLRNGNGAVVSFNDNWGDTNATEIHDAHIAPSNLGESAMIVTLPPGNYTAVVAGNSGPGVAVVEVYDLQ
jgi:hypothetical protein